MIKRIPTYYRLLFFLVAFIIIASCSLPRVVEKSEKSRPGWVYGVSSGYIIVEGVGLTWEDAQNDAMKKLRERIVSSVAVNVSSETDFAISETVIDNMSKYSENVDVRTKISTDFFNSLKGININKSKAFYWEKQKYPNKITKVHYHIMYPFSDKELNSLIAEWEQTDREFTAELDNLEALVAECKTVADLDLYFQKAESLEDIFSGNRKSRASLIKSNIEILIDNLKFEVQEHQRGKLMVKLLSSDRYFKLSPELEFNSTCAKIQDFKLVDDGMTLEINYDADFCYSVENAGFKISQTYGSRDVNSHYSIPDGKNTVRLTVNEPVRFKKSPDNPFAIRWYFPIRIFTETGFTVTRVELVVARESTVDLRKIVGGDDKESYYVTDINKHFDGKGDFSLQFDVPSTSGGRLTLIGFLIDVFMTETSTFKAGGKIYVKPDNEDMEFVFNFENKPIIRSE